MPGVVSWSTFNNTSRSRSNWWTLIVFDCIKVWLYQTFDWVWLAIDEFRWIWVDIAQLPNPIKINSMINALGLIVTEHLHVLIKYRLAISLYILSTLYCNCYIHVTKGKLLDYLYCTCHVIYAFLCYSYKIKIRIKRTLKKRLSRLSYYPLSLIPIATMIYFLI